MADDPFKEITDTVRANAEHARKIAEAGRCKFGHPWKKQWSIQSLGYSPEDQCAADFLLFECSNPDCRETKTVTIPLRGKAYKGMGDAMRKRVEEGGT